MHYQLVQLHKNRDIFIKGNVLRVSMEKLLSEDIIGDDQLLNELYDPNIYNWVSGGGTYLINNRYLVVVRRSDLTRVNPGKFSLFTGRSDSAKERTEPRLIVRELFEELILFSHEKLLYPVNDKYQNIIERCYVDLENAGRFNIKARAAMPVTELNISESTIEIFDDGNANEMPLTWHINNKNDINVLFLFKVDIDVACLKAIDAEYHYEQGECIFHDRDVYLLDIHNKRLSCISDKNKQNIDLSVTEITEHLGYMLELITKNTSVKAIK